MLISFVGLGKPALRHKELTKPMTFLNHGCPDGERTIVMSCGLQMDKTLTCHVSVSCCFC